MLKYLLCTFIYGCTLGAGNQEERNEPQLPHKSIQGMPVPTAKENIVIDTGGTGISVYLLISSSENCLSDSVSIPDVVSLLKDTKSEIPDTSPVSGDRFIDQLLGRDLVRA